MVREYVSTEGKILTANILMIVGSLRSDSFSSQLAHAVTELIGDRAKVTYLDWSGVPLLNQDIESPTPAEVQQVRDALTAADGVWISSPEYNQNIPGGLKNLLDWLSRPIDPTNRSSAKATADKTVAISGVGAASAAAFALTNLAEVVEFIGMKLIGGKGTGLPLDKEAFVTNTLTISAADRLRLGAQVDAFLTAISS